MEKRKSYDDVTNLYIKKKNGDIKANGISMVNMDENPLIDVGLWDESRFYRPMSGKIYRIFPVETHRGCPYKCSFCNSPSQNRLYATRGNFFRKKSIGI